MSRRKMSKSESDAYKAENALTRASNALQSRLDPISLIALREASKSMRGTYTPPEYPKRKALQYTGLNGQRHPLYGFEKLKPGRNKISRNLSLRKVWKSIQDSARLKKYAAGTSATVPGSGVGLRPE